MATKTKTVKRTRTKAKTALHTRRCPHCRSKDIIGYGVKYSTNGKKKRYLCKKCGKTTTRPVTV